jgi:hypothetical protein
MYGLAFRRCAPMATAIRTPLTLPVATRLAPYSASSQLTTAISTTKLRNLAFSFDHWLLSNVSDELETTDDDESQLGSKRMEIQTKPRETERQ